MYLWMCQEACFPSFTDSTVVLARPAMSPPANTHGSLVCMVSGFRSGRPHRLSLMGAMASFTVYKETGIRELGFRRQESHAENVSEKTNGRGETFLPPSARLMQNLMVHSIHCTFTRRYSVTMIYITECVCFLKTRMPISFIFLGMLFSTDDGSHLSMGTTLNTELRFAQDLSPTIRITENASPLHSHNGEGLRKQKPGPYNEIHKRQKGRKKLSLHCPLEIIQRTAMVICDSFSKDSGNYDKREHNYTHCAGINIYARGPRALMSSLILGRLRTETTQA